MRLYFDIFFVHIFITKTYIKKIHIKCDIIIKNIKYNYRFVIEFSPGFTLYFII